jgi:hypothetical protein
LFAGTQVDDGGQFAIGGNLPYMTSFSVDGISSQNTRFGGALTDLFPSVESIEEFKVSTANNNAEFVQVTDVTTTTKSGTNRLTGTGFWYNQNNALSSVSRFAPRDEFGNVDKPEGVTNTFGGAAGGPIVRNKTFFFAAYEGVRRPFELTRQSYVPPDAWRNGDLSSLLPGTQLYNPFTGAPYPNNQVPINPSSATTIEQLYPHANQPGTSLDAPNLIYNADRHFTIDGVDGRVDHNFSSNNKIYGRFTIKNREDSGLHPNPIFGDQFFRSAIRQVVITENAILRPNLLNEAKVGFSNSHGTSGNDFETKAVAFIQAAGFTGHPPLPEDGESPVYSFGDENFVSTSSGQPGDVYSGVLQMSDSLTWLKGRHAVKGGVDFQHVRYRDKIFWWDSNDFGWFDFDGRYTGRGFADFLVGLPYDTYYATTGQPVEPYGNWWAFYLQDSWRPTPKLTIDYGLRYDLRPPMLDANNQLGNFDPNFPGGRMIVQNEQTLADVPQTLLDSVPNTPIVTAAEAGWPEALRRTDRNNFNPRLGVAWRPFGDARTVIRGGIGTYTVPLYGSVNYSLCGNITNEAAVFFNQPTADGFLIQFPNLYNQAWRSVQGLGSQDFRRANQIDASDPKVERDIGWHTGVRASYIGSKTVDIMMSPDFNQIEPNTIGYDTLRDGRPFPDWNVVLSRSNGARARYDSLELELNRRLSAGISFDASYTLSRQDSDAGGATPGGFGGENGSDLLNRFRTADEDYGPVPFSRRHRFISTMYYELPFGHGRQFGAGMGRALDLIAGGWDLSGILLIQSGPLLTPYFSGGDPLGIGADTRGFSGFYRPDQVGDGNLSNPTPEQWFDVAAFVPTPDNSGRNGNAQMGSLIGPDTKVFSLTMGKSFRIAGDSRVRFEAAFSNLFNVENFAVPDYNIRSEGFGRITDVQSADQAGPRTIQVSLRYTF